MSEWYEKFRVGQEVQVIRKITHWTFPDGWGCSWAEPMDETMNKIYKIIEIDRENGYRLDTGKYLFYNYLYPAESLRVIKNTQLEFSFMSE